LKQLVFTINQRILPYVIQLQFPLPAEIAFLAGGGI
jgi:hypothetical protein